MIIQQTDVETPVAFEKHYRIGELARLWGSGRDAVRKLIEDIPAC